MNNLDVLILHMPHSGTEIPDKTGYVVPDEVLCAEADLVKDWGVEEIFGIEGVDRLKPEFSRLFCDVERFRQDEEEPLAEKGFGFAYTRCQNGSVMRELSKDDKDRILKNYYDLHHQDFERLTDKKIQEFGFVFVVDCHTFPAVPLAWEEPAEDPRPDICIGTCMALSPQGIRKHTIKYFEEKGYSVGWNYPYAGTVLPDKYFRLANDRVKGMMIEINRRLFFNEQTKQIDADAIKRLHGEIRKLLETISTMEIERQKCRDNPDVYLVMENDDTGLYGYINSKGEWVIDPKLLAADSFAENGLALATAALVDLHGFINKRGEWVIEPKYWGTLNAFSSNGLAVASLPEYENIDFTKESFDGFINEKAEIVIAPRFSWAKSFTENGFACVCDGNTELWGYINETGVWAIEPKYKKANDFSYNGLAAVQDVESELWGYVDEKGGIIIEFQYRDVESFSQNGLAAVEDAKTELWGYINEKGEWMIEPRFPVVWGFSENELAAVKDRETELWGFIDDKGEWTIDPRFEEARCFSKNGLAAVKETKPCLWGYINEKGDWMIEQQFSDTWGFEDDGYALIIEDKTYDERYIDEKGNRVIAQEFIGPAYVAYAVKY